MKTISRCIAHTTFIRQLLKRSMKQRAVLCNSLLIFGFCSSSLNTSAQTISAQTISSAAYYRAQGLQYRQKERFAEAITALKTAVELEPDHLPGRVSLGWTLHLAGQDRLAAQTLQATLQRDPFHVPTLNALGIVYLVNDDPVAAATVHSWAIALSPNNEIAYYNLSLAWERLQQYDWAINTAQQATILESDNPHPFVALAIAQWGKGDKIATQQSYQAAINLDSRYRDGAFLDWLSESGFSTQQIATSKQVLKTL